MKRLAKSYLRPQATFMPMNLQEPIAASAGKRDEEYEVVVTRNGQEVIVRNGGFGTLDELFEWFREFFNK